MALREGLTRFGGLGEVEIAKVPSSSRRRGNRSTNGLLGPTSC